MSNSPDLLVEAASAVAGLGSCQSDISILDDASLIEGMRLVSALDSQAQTYKLWLSVEIARRSSHELGYGGLARRNGSATPAIFIQAMTGTSIEEATKLARLGQSIVDAEASIDAEGSMDADSSESGSPPGRTSNTAQAPIAQARCRVRFLWMLRMRFGVVLGNPTRL